MRPVTLDILQECLALRVANSQTSFVASNAPSLAEAKVNPTLVPLAIYNEAARGWDRPTVPMGGFTMYELAAGVGFILRLRIDEAHQGTGYGHAAMREVIHRLGLHPEVKMIATIYNHGNCRVASLYRGPEFVAWEIGYAKGLAGEVY